MSVTLLEEHAWRDRESAHRRRADALTAGWRQRQLAGPGGTRLAHPVDDFLFTYYPFRPAALRRWHPGAGVALAGAGADERAAWKWYRPVGGPDAADAETADAVVVDTDALVAAKGRSIRFIARLLASTANRAGNYGCFGLHEWAMVYRRGEHRHPAPLRLGQGETDDVVEGHRISCSHIDAYRFFTPEALPLNRLRPTRENQPELEQPGCLHAGMDVYKWASKLGPLVPGEVLLDCFELARDIRQVDMRASPYDLREWGMEPITIETPDGKADYVRQQRAFADRGNELRGRVVAAIGVAGVAVRDAEQADTAGEATPER